MGDLLYAFKSAAHVCGQRLISEVNPARWHVDVTITLIDGDRAQRLLDLGRFLGF